MTGFEAADKVWELVPDADTIWSPGEVGMIAADLVTGLITEGDILAKAAGMREVLAQD